MSKKEKLRTAYKVLKFWNKVLLSTNLLNNENDRNDYAAALKTIKQHSK